MLEKAYQLVIRKGPNAGQTILLVAPTLTLGRDPVADVVIDDAEVSRLHARLVETPDGYRLQDLGSTNGTFVDGRNISAGPILLEPDQEIQLGSSVVIAYQEMPDEAEADMAVEPAATMLEEPAEPVEPAKPVETVGDAGESAAAVTAVHTAMTRTAGRIMRALVLWSEAHGGEVVSAETGFVLRRGPDTVRAPDVAFVRSGRDVQAGPFVEGAPDVAVEVLSSDARAGATASKVRDYLGAGAAQVWVADPESHTLTVHTPPNLAVTLSTGDVLSGGEALPGFALAVARLFAP